MRTNKIGALVTLAALLALVALASPLAGANPPAQQDVQVAASVAPLLQYQGRLLDAPTGDPVADGDHTMVFRFYNVETGGSALWTETKDVPVANGLFNTVLGDTTALDQSLFNNGQALWLGVKVGADPEAAPRQPLLPVAYALGLVPGAVIDVDNADVADGALAPAKIDGIAWTGANHGAGSGLDADLLDGQHASAFAGASHNHDGSYVNTTGPDGMSGSSADPILEVTQTGTGAALRAVSEEYYGMVAETSAGYAGILGWGTAGSAYGVYGFSQGSYGGYFHSNSGPALYADGAIEAEKVVYSSPRTHYFMVGSERFVAQSNVDYYNFGGTGGAYKDSGSSGHLVASVHLPHGAVVTGFKAFFMDSSSSNVTVTLYRQGMTSSYTMMAQVISSGSAGYGNLTDTTISVATIDNTNYSYVVSAYCSSWSGINLKIKGALITYTIDEAP